MGVYEVGTERFEYKGRAFELETFADECGGEPWENEDGHGPVSGWERRPKKPGERILYECRDGERMFYDYAEAVKIARQDRWGWIPGRLRYDDATNTAECEGYIAKGSDVNDAIRKLYAMVREEFGPGEIAALAADGDYERMRAFCAGDWFYLVLKVSPFCECCDSPDETRADYLGGVESDSEEYIMELARELADNIISQEEE